MSEYFVFLKKKLEIYSNSFFLFLKKKEFEKYLLTLKNYIYLNRIALIKIIFPCMIIFWAFGSCSFSKNLTQKNVNLLFSIADSIHTLYSSKPDYWGLSTKYLIDNEILSEDIIHDDYIFLNDNLVVKIGSGAEASTISPKSTTFDIVLSNLNKSQCIAYVEAGFSDQQLLLLDKISIVNDSGEFIFTWGAKNSLPVKKYSSREFCSSRNNTVIWSLK